MDNIAFASVALTSKNYGVAYLDQQDRLKASIKEIYPDAPLFFWRDDYPKNSKPFLESLYGFKVHAVQAAREAGHQRIVWFDTGMILHQPLRHMQSIVAVKDDSAMTGVTSNNALSAFNIERESLKGKTLVGGSFYYFDFYYPICNDVFGLWMTCEVNGIFGSQDEEAAGQLQGHRADETCMALSLYSCGLGPVSYDLVGYQGEVMSKRHFK